MKRLYLLLAAMSANLTAQAAAPHAAPDAAAPTDQCTRFHLVISENKKLPFSQEVGNGKTANKEGHCYATLESGMDKSVCKSAAVTDGNVTISPENVHHSSHGDTVSCKFKVRYTESPAPESDSHSQSAHLSPSGFDAHHEEHHDGHKESDHGTVNNGHA